MVENKTLNNRYVLETEIGRGGMGVVYRAHDIQLNRVVAIKVLPTEFIHDKQFLSRFQNEILNTAKLQHPNIVSIYDVGVDGGTHYFVMQFIDGQDLKAYIEQKERLSLDETRRIVEQVASALDYAHSFGIVHRDIKPENILIDHQGTARVTDFGIAKSAEGTRLTGGIIGTPEYMSPEQARGESLDGCADQYALGIVAYEMLTGTTPFRRSTTQPWALVNMHITVTPPYPKEFCSDLPDNVCDALMKTLEKTADKRFATCSDFARLIKNDVNYIKSNPVNKDNSKNDVSKKSSNAIIMWIIASLVLSSGLFFIFQSSVVPGVDNSPQGTTKIDNSSSSDNSKNDAERKVESSKGEPTTNTITSDKNETDDKTTSPPENVKVPEVSPTPEVVNVPEVKAIPDIQQADRDAIVSLVERWRYARQSEDIYSYLDCYTFPVQHKGSNKSINQLRTFEQKMFNKHDNIVISTSNNNINPSGDGAIISFYQVYDADDNVTSRHIHTEGEKKLVVRRTTDGWKICKEEESK
jgi:serine/threonine protein kinase